MKKIAYEELDSLSTDAIAEITALREDFVVLADLKIGRHLQKFLENEETFGSSSNTVLDRLAYVSCGWDGFFVLLF